MRGARALVASAVVALVLHGAAAAQSCRTVHGRMSLTNGTPGVRIWVIGTRRMLGVVQQDLTFDQLPSNLRRTWSAHGRLDNQGLSGDFRVCALTRARPGWMQMVRVEGASHLRVRERGKP